MGEDYVSVYESIMRMFHAINLHHYPRETIEVFRKVNQACHVLRVRINLVPLENEIEILFERYWRDV